MKRNISLFACLSWTIISFAQEKQMAQNTAAPVENAPAKSVDTKLQVPDIDTNRYYAEVDQMPEFAGGEDSLKFYLARNIRYPKEARKKNVQGRVILRFVVERDGSISDIVATATPDKSLEEAFVRVVESMPKWKPGMINGIAVKSYYKLPITYKLD